MDAGIFEFSEFGITLLPFTNTLHLSFRIPLKGNRTSILSRLNFYAMVQVDISQLTAESNVWREKLRLYKEEFARDEMKLQETVRQSISKDQLQEVEHLHNQFHIQLINIHDLKQSIKTHDRKMQFEKVAFNGFVNEDSLTRHEELMGEFRSLEQTLLDLREEFNKYLHRTK
jgi:hypothetical protein